LSTGSESTPINSFSGSFRRDGNSYTLDLTFDADAFFNNAGQATEEQVPMQMMSQMLTITYTARLPGEVKEHNGTLLEDGRIQWTLPYSGTMTILSTGSESTPINSFSGSFRRDGNSYTLDLTFDA
ncbi:LppM family (lipo)protein, partial [Streptococcus pneumoniae]|uniref:LppM family (lipo)protein n=1 Tax=Streptococcus pneumoniae TaxID=1313 RepID=UPI0016627F28